MTKGMRHTNKCGEILVSLRDTGSSRSGETATEISWDNRSSKGN